MKHVLSGYLSADLQMIVLMLEVEHIETKEIEVKMSTVSFIVRKIYRLKWWESTQHFILLRGNFTYWLKLKNICICCIKL